MSTHETQFAVPAILTNKRLAKIIWSDTYSRERYRVDLTCPCCRDESSVWFAGWDAQTCTGCGVELTRTPYQKDTDVDAEIARLCEEGIVLWENTIEETTTKIVLTTSRLDVTDTIRIALHIETSGTVNGEPRDTLKSCGVSRYISENEDNQMFRIVFNGLLQDLWSAANSQNAMLFSLMRDLIDIDVRGSASSRDHLLHRSECLSAAAAAAVAYNIEHTTISIPECSFCVPGGIYV